jgi:hypothetical protein
VFDSEVGERHDRVIAGSVVLALAKPLVETSQNAGCELPTYFLILSEMDLYDFYERGRRPLINGFRCFVADALGRKG